ncbi:MAG: hypothetical protein ACPLXO_01310 [Desulfurella sp.]|uniref:hypothetical protein n=1 Tax=Desulfurella sp. TaxID=1962857 RepID=UPI003C9DDCD7
MKEKILDIIQGLIKTSDIEEFLSLLKQKSVYIKKQPLEYLSVSKNDIAVLFELLKDFFKKRTFIPKNTLIALFFLLSYVVSKKIKKFNILNIDSDLLIGFCIYLVEKDIQKYLDSQGGNK